MMPQSAMGPALEVEYRSILMPLSRHRVSDEMTATALRLAAESGAPAWSRSTRSRCR